MSAMLPTLKSLRKNTYLTWGFLALFLAQLFAPAAIAATSFDRKINGANGAVNGIIICTTTGLKLLTPEGKLVSYGDKGSNAAREHCFACFTSAFIGISPEFAGLPIVETPSYQHKFVVIEVIAFQQDQFAFSARAPPFVRVALK